MYTSSHAYSGMIWVLHSLKSDTVYIHIFNTIYWKPSHRKISMQWVHWVHFYLDGYFTLSWFLTPFISFTGVILVVRSQNFNADILIRTILIRRIDYLLSFVYFVGLEDKQSWIVLNVRDFLGRLTPTVLKQRTLLRIVRIYVWSARTS